MLVEILVGRLLRRRHHVVVVCPAIAPHYFSRSDVDDAAIEHILRWRRNREQVRAFCEARRVRFVSLRPSVSDVDVQAVIRSIR